jgi:capsid protein
MSQKSRNIQQAKLEKLKAVATASIGDFRNALQENLQPSRLRKRSASIPGPKERDFTRFDREKLIGMSREFFDKFPIVRAIISNMQDTIVGTGAKLSMQSGNPKWDQEVETWWASVRDSLDVRNLRTWGQLNRAWWLRRFVDGDVGVHKMNAENGGLRPLRTIEADLIRRRKYDYLDGADTSKSGQTQVDQGIEYDANGRAVSYYIGPRLKNQMDIKAEQKTGQRILSENFVFYANLADERIDSLRGTPGLLVNIAVIQDISEIMENVIQKIKNEAFIGLAFMMDASYGGTFFGGEGEKDKTDIDGTKRRHVKMTPGMNLNLGTGEKVDLLGMKSPNSELMPFLRFCLRIAGAAYGWPLEMFLLDVSETNYSGGRLLVEMQKTRVKVEQDSLARVCSDVFVSEIESAIAAKSIVPPKGFNLRHKWSMKAMPYYDPAKEANANGANLDRYLTSPQAILAESGDRDLQDILDDWAEFKQELDKRGLKEISEKEAIVIEKEPTKEKQPKGKTQKKDSDDEQ